MTSREFKDRLHRRARRARVSVSDELTSQLEAYYRLLCTWNAKINLTALNLQDTSDESFDRLMVEPLAATRHLSTTTGRMIDVGSGGGSPALPMKLALPSMTLLMVESKTRKSVFLREAIRVLGVAGADVATARFEGLLAVPELHEACDLLTIRAVRVEPRVLTGLQAFLKPGGQLFLFKGPSGGDAAEALAPPLSWQATFPLVESLRSRLVVFEKTHLGRSKPPRSQL